MAYAHAQWAMKVTQAFAGEEGLVSPDHVHQIGLFSIALKHQHSWW
jgi:hypothetical protein